MASSTGPTQEAAAAAKSSLRSEPALSSNLGIEHLLLLDKMVTSLTSVAVFATSPPSSAPRSKKVIRCSASPLLPRAHYPSPQVQIKVESSSPAPTSQDQRSASSLSGPTMTLPTIDRRRGLEEAAVEVVVEEGQVEPASFALRVHCLHLFHPRSSKADPSTLRRGSLVSRLPSKERGR